MSCGGNKVCTMTRHSRTSRQTIVLQKLSRQLQGLHEDETAATSHLRATRGYGEQSLRERVRT
eukprot:1652098-Rhodomonas_salina.2